MANTDAAVSTISTWKTASGSLLLRGWVFRILCNTEDATLALRSLAACASAGMAVIGFCVRSTGSGEFIGSTLSAIYLQLGNRLELKIMPTSQGFCREVGLPDLSGSRLFYLLINRRLGLVNHFLG